jgi:hypothetical protein
MGLDWIHISLARRISAVLVFTLWSHECPHAFLEVSSVLPGNAIAQRCSISSDFELESSLILASAIKRVGCLTVS